MGDWSSVIPLFIGIQKLSNLTRDSPIYHELCASDVLGFIRSKVDIEVAMDESISHPTIFPHGISGWPVRKNSETPLAASPMTSNKRMRERFYIRSIFMSSRDRLLEKAIASRAASRMWRRQTLSFLSMLNLCLCDYFIPKMTAHVFWGSEVYLPPIK